MANKKSFILYTEWADAFDDLNNEQAGELIHAIFAYETTGEDPVIEDQTARFAFKMIKKRLSENDQKYAEKAESAKKAREARANRFETRVDESETRTEKSETNSVNDNVNVNVNDKDKNTLTCAPAKEPDGFAEFWAQYPKKAAKGAALKSWQKLKPGKGLQRKILQSLMAQKASDKWHADGGRFIPNPSTWLNQCRWEDDPTTFAKAPPGKNAFNSFEQRQYSDDLVRQLIGGQS